MLHNRHLTCYETGNYVILSFDFTGLLRRYHTNEDPRMRCRLITSAVGGLVRDHWGSIEHDPRRANKY